MIERTWFNRFQRWIAYYQIAGALLGAYSVVQLIVAGSAKVAWLIPMTAFFAINALAGVLVLRGSPPAFVVTVLAQVPQLVDAKTSRFFYHLLSGASFGFRWQEGFVGFASTVGGQFSMLWGDFSSTPTWHAINFVPILVLYAIFRARATDTRRAGAA